jgi:hypothetical protein
MQWQRRDKELYESLELERFYGWAGHGGHIMIRHVNHASRRESGFGNYWRRVSSYGAITSLYIQKNSSDHTEIDLRDSVLGTPATLKPLSNFDFRPKHPIHSEGA